MSEVQVQVWKKYTVPDRVIADVIIDMAGYGIKYWAKRAVWDSEKREYTVFWAEDDSDDPDMLSWHVLAYQDIAQAAAEVAFNTDIRLNNTLTGYVREFFRELEAGEEFPGGDIDSEVADAIIQVAIFGEVIYG